MKFVVSKPVAAAISPAPECAPTLAPVKLSSGVGRAVPSAPTISVPSVDKLIHLEFERGEFEINEVQSTIPSALYDELFER